MVVASITRTSSIFSPITATRVFQLLSPRLQELKIRRSAAHNCNCTHIAKLRRGAADNTRHGRNENELSCTLDTCHVEYMISRAARNLISIHPHCIWLMNKALYWVALAFNMDSLALPTAKSALGMQPRTTTGTMQHHKGH